MKELIPLKAIRSISIWSEGSEIFVQIHRKNINPEFWNMSLLDTVLTTDAVAEVQAVIACARGR